MITEVLAAVLMVGGALFMLLAALGLVRLPDLYTRTSAATKAATVGSGGVLLALAIHFRELDVAVRALATVIFLLLTAPISAHMIGRAAYFSGVPLYKGTRFNDLLGRYDRTTHELSGSREREG